MAERRCAWDKKSLSQESQEEAVDGQEIMRRETTTQASEPYGKNEFGISIPLTGVQIGDLKKPEWDH